MLTPGHGFTLAADAFHIRTADRIALSNTLSGAAVAAVLRTNGITNASQVRFFTNALDTTTDGYEITGGWTGTILRSARVGLNLGYGRYRNKVDRLTANAAVPSLPLLGVAALDLLTTAQPSSKLTASGHLDTGPLTVNADIVHFGSFRAISLAAEQV